MKLHQLRWFNNRIGKRVYRDDSGCKCHHCKETTEKGLIVINKSHADYLYNIEHEYACDGFYLNYRDKK